MIKESTLNATYEILQLIKQSGLTIAGYFKSIGKSPNSFYNTIGRIKKEAGTGGNDYDIDKIVLLYSSIVNRDVVFSEIEEETKEETHEEEVLDTDDRVESSYLRNEEGKIIGYKFKVFRRDNTPVQGVLTRDEMQLIYRLYSYYGASITQREVSRHFPDYSLVDFKRILRAFNITKASGPFAPHMYEEKSEEELKEIHLREKENDFLKKVEKDELRDAQSAAIKLARRNKELEQTIEELSKGISITITNPENIIDVTNTKVDSDMSMILYLSDMHIGAKCESDTLYPNPYTYEEIARRLSVAQKRLLQFGHLDELIICLMGDSLDGMDQQTSRRDHYMPQCMDNNEQLHSFMQLMYDFIAGSRILANKVKVYCVNCGNHGGTWEYTANLALCHLITKSFSDIDFVLFQTFIGHFWFKDHLYLLCHGKDRAFMKRPLPNNLDERTKVMIHEWLNANDLTGYENVHFVKGDLHSDTYNSCLAFDYRNVLSLFGASDYSNFNFSRNAYGISYDLFIGNNRTMGTFEEL